MRSAYYIFLFCKCIFNQDPNKKDNKLAEQAMAVLCPLGIQQEEKMYQLLQTVASSDYAYEYLLEPLLKQWWWHYDFDLARCWSTDTSYLQATGQIWKEIGWGRDRDVDSCRILVNVANGKLGQWFDGLIRHEQNLFIWEDYTVHDLVPIFANRIRTFPTREELELEQTKQETL